MRKSTNDMHESNDMLDDEPRSMPLSFEDAGESLTVASPSARRRPGFGTMMLVAVVATGSVGLLSMRYFAREGSASEPASDAGKLVESFLKERSKADAGVALPADLLDTDAYASLRIERSDLTKDPFVLEGGQPTVAPVTGVPASHGAEPPVDRRAAQVEGWNAIVDAGAAEIEVRSTLVSSRAAQSVATVNGKVLRVGDRIEAPRTAISFELIEVGSGSARFRAHDATLGAERIVSIAAKTR